MPLYTSSSTAVAPTLIVPPAAAGTPPGATAWPSANRALFTRFQLEVPVPVRYINWSVGVSSGNVQLGVVQFSGTGHTTYTRVMNTGIIACPTAGDIHTDLGATTLPGGDYAAFLWIDNVTATARWTSTAAIGFTRLGIAVSSLGTGVPASGTISWTGGTQVPSLTLEADV